MSKSVLVMDTPKYCALCVLRSGVHHPFCRVNNRDITDLSIRPDWCPLKPLPEKNTTENDMTDYQCGMVDGRNQCINEIQEEILMINLTGKSVFVKTQKEYENILNIARLQGFDKWSDKVSLSSRDIKLPNILIFKDNGTVAYWSDKGVLEASEIIEYEEKIKDAVKLVRTFAKSPDRTALIDSLIKSLKLLADTVES
jgi:hypothetical protein|nr:MAG TPA: hypothetical protein [Caudoviricetes sp.]